MGISPEIWAIKTGVALKSPLYVIVAFQTYRHAKVANDSTVFDQIHTKNIRPTLTGDYCPNKRITMEFSKSEYGEAF